jgi:hypothetical protein
VENSINEVLANPEINAGLQKFRKSIMQAQMAEMMLTKSMHGEAQARLGLAHIATEELTQRQKLMIDAKAAQLASAKARKKCQHSG